MAIGCKRLRRDVVGWKLVKGYTGNLVAKLKIPKDSRVKRMKHEPSYFATDRAKVLEMYEYNNGYLGQAVGSPHYEAKSLCDQNFTYKKGEVVKPEEEFTENPKDVCGPGIYFCLDVETLSDV
jgi:hypothetical protein